jgi:hypothetical protein
MQGSSDDIIKPRTRNDPIFTFFVPSRLVPMVMPQPVAVILSIWKLDLERLSFLLPINNGNSHLPIPDFMNISRSL